MNRPGHTGPPERPCGLPPDDRNDPINVFPLYHDPHTWQDDTGYEWFCYGDRIQA